MSESPFQQRDMVLLTGITTRVYQKYNGLIGRVCQVKDNGRVLVGLDKGWNQVITLPPKWLRAVDPMEHKQYLGKYVAMPFDPAYPYGIVSKLPVIPMTQSIPGESRVQDRREEAYKGRYYRPTFQLQETSRENKDTKLEVSIAPKDMASLSKYVSMARHTGKAFIHPCDLALIVYGVKYNSEGPGVPPAKRCDYLYAHGPAHKHWRRSEAVAKENPDIIITTFHRWNEREATSIVRWFLENEGPVISTSDLCDLLVSFPTVLVGTVADYMGNNINLDYCTPAATLYPDLIRKVSSIDWSPLLCVLSHVPSYDPERDARIALKEYARFLCLKVMYDDYDSTDHKQIQMCPSKATGPDPPEHVQAAILKLTQENYDRDCRILCGRRIEHTEFSQHIQSKYTTTCLRYFKMYGPPLHVCARKWDKYNALDDPNFARVTGLAAACDEALQEIWERNAAGCG